MENNVNDSTAANKSYQANATNESMMTLETSDNDAIDNLCDISSLSIGDGAPVVVFDDANKKQQSLNECERNDAIKTETKSTNTTIRMCKKCNCLCDTNAMEKRAVNKTSSMPPSIRVRGNDKCIEPCSFDISEIELNPCATKTETETEIIDPTKNENENQLRNFVNNSSKLPIIVDETLSSTSPPKSLPLITTTPISTNPIDKQNYHPTTYLPSHIRNLPKTQSLDLADSELPGLLPKMHSFDQTRPIYPNVPFSPYGSPFGSPRIGRRRPPLRESRRISIEQMGSFLQLNQYKLMDQIGQGSYGLVKLAYSEEDSTHYAMKILSKRKLLRKAGLMGRGPKKGTSPLDRVYREIAVLKKLDHPNVVKLVEVLDDPLEDSLYLVFELLQQGEVLSVPTTTPLSEERVWSVLRDALLGLEYLHYQRIIHGDIKPDNLLIGESGRVKIADLGVCNEFLDEDAFVNNGSTAGTPAFRAPETLINGQHMFSGKAADIWALGATIYSLVYGNVPFVANNVPAVYEKIKNDQLHFPQTIQISNELRDLIEGMLDKDPTKRLTLPQIKEHPWTTSGGAHPLPSEEANCRLVQVNDEDMSTVVKSIPKLDTLILIKTMLKKHSFQNPFIKGVSGRARLERFTRAGRSNSAPGAYHMIERQMSSDSILPSVSESVASPSSETSSEIENIP